MDYIWFYIDHCVDSSITEPITKFAVLVHTNQTIFCQKKYNIKGTISNARYYIKLFTIVINIQIVLDQITQTHTSVSYTHLDVYKRQ